ncbi:hypothetical protein [Metapseudomonas boanensis]|uniref:Uncharacterized protein n=1 Tax=Metapseudomonas boanensis TaxID=2822138 RepID=A0ABS5XNG9_9GAMM|nr:hypothetical protein [Pseudomonas boanensis]MBT8769252.1 hypothetical protein [Pseudomonas boanensis]
MPERLPEIHTHGACDGLSQFNRKINRVHFSDLTGTMSQFFENILPAAVTVNQLLVV